MDLRLHLHDFDLLAKDVFTAVCRPFVGYFRHDGRRRNGVDGSKVCKRIRYMCSALLPSMVFIFLAMFLFLPLDFWAFPQIQDMPFFGYLPI